MTYSTVVRELRVRLPELTATAPSSDDDLPNVFLGSFALVLRDLLRRKGADAELIARSFGFLNEMAASADDDVVNLLVVSVLEIFTDDAKCIEEAMRQLSPAAQALLQRTLAGWPQEH